MNAYQCAVEKMRAWLDIHFDAEGKCTIDPDDVNYYDKLPYLLTMAGLRAKGGRVARRVLECFVDERGDLKSSAALENRIYSMGWLTLGAVIVERFDLAEVLARRLIELQDPESGGIVIADEDAGAEVAEVCFSAGVGMGLAVAGKLEHARLMADRLVALLEAQLEEGCFYNRFRRDGSVLVKKAEGGWEKAYDLQEDEQRPANFATVVNNLVWVGRAARDPDYFAAAQRYVDLVYHHEQNPAHFGRATKFGWSMLNLYEETGDRELLERARELGDVLVSQQSDDGLWNPQPGNQADAPAWLRLSYSSDCAMTVCALANLPE